MMRLAAVVGIEVPDVRLIDRDEIDALPDGVWHQERLAYAVRRFDRDASCGLVHIEDFAQVRGVYPSRKYDGNLETVGALAYRGHDEQALTEFARRVAFNVLIGNGDSHLKNWSLIYRDRRVPTISPAYDLVATEAYRPNSVTEDLGLKFGGSRRFDRVNVATFSRLRAKLGAEANLADVVADVVAATRDAWPRFAEEFADDDTVRATVGRSVDERGRTLLHA